MMSYPRAKQTSADLYRMGKINVAANFICATDHKLMLSPTDFCAVRNVSTNIYI